MSLGLTVVPQRPENWQLYTDWNRLLQQHRDLTQVRRSSAGGGGLRIAALTLVGALASAIEPGSLLCRRAVVTRRPATPMSNRGVWRHSAAPGEFESRFLNGLQRFVNRKVRGSNPRPGAIFRVCKFGS